MTMASAGKTRWDDRSFHLDPTKPRWPQIAKIAAQMAAIFGGLLLGLASTILYPMLLTGQGYAVAYLGPIMFAFAASFVAIRRNWLPPDMPLGARLWFRFGIGVCAVGWVIGLFGIANGYRTTVAVRDVPMAYKRTSTPSDPHKRSYYVGAEVWPSSHAVFEVPVPRALYARLDVAEAPPRLSLHNAFASKPGGDLLRLAVGRGRFGIDWLHGVIGVVPTDH